MTEMSRKAAQRPALNSIAAQLFVTDIEASRRFFVEKLGFGLDFTYGNPSFYAQVSCDNARLSLRHVDEPIFAGDIREREHLLSASITVATADDIGRLFTIYEASGVPFHQALRDEPWGARTFIVRDPDGNLILFAGSTG